MEPLAAAAVYPVIVVSALGWWRPSLFEVVKAAPRWLLVGPLLMLLGLMHLPRWVFGAGPAATAIPTT